ncbi:IS3 family transposase [Lactobacillus bombicola]
MQGGIEKWIKYYNQTSIRYTLKDRTPLEYRNTALTEMK